jgi:hypothetical protein
MATNNIGPDDLPQGPSNPEEDKAILDGLRNPATSRLTRLRRVDSGSTPVLRQQKPATIGKVSNTLNRAAGLSGEGFDRVYKGREFSGNAAKDTFFNKFKGMSDEQIEAERDKGTFSPYAKDKNHEDELVLTAKARARWGAGSASSERRGATAAATEEGGKFASAEGAEGIAPEEEKGSETSDPFDPAHFSASNYADQLALVRRDKEPKIHNDYANILAATHSQLQEAADQINLGAIRSSGKLPKQAKGRVNRVRNATNDVIQGHLNDAITHLNNHLTALINGNDTGSVPFSNGKTGVQANRRGLGADLGVDATDIGAVGHFRLASESLIKAARVLHKNSSAAKSTGILPIVTKRLSNALSSLKKEVGDNSGSEDLGKSSEVNDVFPDHSDTEQNAKIKAEYEQRRAAEQIATYNKVRGKEYARNNMVRTLPTREQKEQQRAASEADWTKLNLALNDVAAKKRDEKLIQISNEDSQSRQGSEPSTPRGTGPFGLDANDPRIQNLPRPVRFDSREKTIGNIRAELASERPLTRAQRDARAAVKARDAAAASEFASRRAGNIIAAPADELFKRYYPRSIGSRKAEEYAPTPSLPYAGSPDVQAQLRAYENADKQTSAEALRVTKTPAEKATLKGQTGPFPEKMYSKTPVSRSGAFIAGVQTDRPAANIPTNPLVPVGTTRGPKLFAPEANEVVAAGFGRKVPAQPAGIGEQPVTQPKKAKTKSSSGKAKPATSPEIDQEAAEINQVDKKNEPFYLPAKIKRPS